MNLIWQAIAHLKLYKSLLLTKFHTLTLRSYNSILTCIWEGSRIPLLCPPVYTGFLGLACLPLTTGLSCLLGDWGNCRGGTWGREAGADWACPRPRCWGRPRGWLLFEEGGGLSDAWASAWIASCRALVRARFLSELYVWAVVVEEAAKGLEYNILDWLQI